MDSTKTERDRTKLDIIKKLRIKKWLIVIL